MLAADLVVIATIVTAFGGWSDYIRVAENEPPFVAIPARTELLDSHSALPCPVYSPNPEAQSRQASH
jgi:hypothetical protein